MTGIARSSQNRFKRCDRCTFQRMNRLFRNGSTTCNLCLMGDYRAPEHEYCTGWDMRLASMATQARLTRLGMMSAVVRAGRNLQAQAPGAAV